MTMSARFTLAVGLAAALAAQAGADEKTVLRGAQVSPLVTPLSLDVDLRDLPFARPWEPGDPIKEVPRRFYPQPGDRTTPPAELETPPDPLLAVQEAAGVTGHAPTLNLNFDSQVFNGVNPPDPVGDVGPNHYVQAINHPSGTSVVIYNKSGGVLAGPFILSTLGAPAPCNAGFGDPIVLYDSLADRWLLSEFAATGANLCVYISQTPNPVSGGWFFYRFVTPNFPDYPKYAVWPDAYYVGTNEGNAPPAYALDRVRMLAGQAATFQRFTAPGLAAFGFEMMVPADLDGPTPPPAGAPGLFLRHRDDEVHNPPGNPAQDTVEVFEFRVNWASPGSSTFTGPISIPVTEFSSELCGLTSFNCFPQPGSGVTLDPLREVIMFRAQYRNFGAYQALSANFVTDADGEGGGDPLERGGVRWVELRKTSGNWFLQQEGTQSPDTTVRWLAATALDRSGNLGLVYNVTSPSVAPGLRFTGRLATDPPSTLQAEGVIVPGSVANSSNRWGDYAALSVDPSDDCTFWYTGMYNPTSQWRTRVATFKHDVCGAVIPTVSVNDVTVTEGNAGTTNATFTLSLSSATVLTVTVNFTTADGTAVAPGDYTPQSGSRTFNPGVTTQTVSVPVVGDLAVEPNETFALNLTGASNATIADGQGIGTILNDDVPSLSVNDVTVAEGNAGTTNATFTLSLSSASPFPVTVNFTTADGTAVAPGDYTAQTGSRTFNPGVTTQTVSVPVAGDLTVEPNETFALNLTGASNATIADGQGIGTILNDDFPSLSVNDVTVTEGDTGTLNATFTVSLSQVVPFPVSVDYAAAPGTATAGVDFGSVAGTVGIPAGSGSATVAVPVVGDRVNEPTETFFLNLSGASNATIADGQGQGNITDNDAAGFSIADVSVRERVTPATAVAIFTVTLAPTQPGTVTVNFATANGTATAGSDYVATNGTLTFAAGQPTQPINVTINPDALTEGLETFTVNLTASSGPPIAVGTATGRILDKPLGGDFNADDRNDLLWRHDVSGENVLWFMNGPVLISGTFTTPPTLSDVRWKMVGTNDFNADGKPDILWRHNTSGENVLWFMNGATLVSGTFLTPSALADTRWNMSGTGDFDLDGRPDILWRHNTSGEIVVWFMNGSVLASGTFLTPPAFTDVNWQTVGTGDFNSDGKTDILWRHALSGQNVVWFMDRTALVSGAFTNPPALADTNWRMVATSDYNFDGKVDIVWRHSVSGENVMWFMNGINLISGTFTTPSSLPDTNWKIVGPR